MADPSKTGGDMQDATLLDYFAGQAMAGMLSGTASDGNATWPEAEEIARVAYHYAAAMLAEKARREKE